MHSFYNIPYKLCLRVNECTVFWAVTVNCFGGLEVFSGEIPNLFGMFPASFLGCTSVYLQSGEEQHLLTGNQIRFLTKRRCMKWWWKKLARVKQLSYNVTLLLKSHFVAVWEYFLVLKKKKLPLETMKWETLNQTEGIGNMQDLIFKFFTSVDILHVYRRKYEQKD